MLKNVRRINTIVSLVGKREFSEIYVMIYTAAMKVYR
jgi:hypothetical protein